MPARQLRLFPHPKPLLERFGRDFFRAVPAVPGVYLLSNEADRVLYVGQSGNLRLRLATYKNAHPDHLPRKIIRLVHAVRRITWETCDSALQARLRENELLRLHRPRFNSANAYPKAYCFIGLRADAARLTLTWTREDPAAGATPSPLDAQTEWAGAIQEPAADRHFGAFKAHTLGGLSALLRLLWTACHPAGSPGEFPRRLLAYRPPRTFTFGPESGAAELAGLLEGFLDGASEALLEWLNAKLPALETLPPFHQNRQAQDLEVVAHFFEAGPRRNRELHLRHQLPTPVIPQERLDDLLAHAREPARSTDGGAVSTPDEL